LGYSVATVGELPPLAVSSSFTCEQPEIAATMPAIANDRHPALTIDQANGTTLPGLRMQAGRFRAAFSAPISREEGFGNNTAGSALIPQRRRFPARERSWEAYRRATR
jgi:hypothetical protein